MTLHEINSTETVLIDSFMPGDDNTFTFSPKSPLKEYTTYYVVLGTGITDVAGNSLAETKFSFTTGDSMPPSVKMIRPTDNGIISANSPEDSTRI